MFKNSSQPRQTAGAEIAGPIDHYRRALATAQASQVESIGTWSKFGWIRGISFLAALGLIACGFLSIGSIRSPWFWGAGVAAAGFLGIAYWHERLGDKIRFARRQINMYSDGIARIERRLAEVAVWPVDIPPEVIDISRDLDLFGPNSLHKMLASVHTPEGVVCLAQWMANPADPAVIVGRQTAARQLAPLVEWREAFELRVREMAAANKSRIALERKSDSAASGLVQWCRAPGWLENHRWVLILSRGAICGLVVSIGLGVTGLVPPELSFLLAAGSILVNFFLAVFFSGSVHDEFNQVSSGHREVSVYSRLFRMIDECSASDGSLSGLKDRMFRSGADVRQEMSRLTLLASMANFRSGLTFIPWLLLQFTLFVDLHILVPLEKWKKERGCLAADWFLALGEWETLAAIARLAWENPDWAWPTVVEANSQQDRFAAKEMGHPLIPRPAVVTNSVTLGPTGRFLLVTGSNMSGKSTLLRAIGLNTFLAQLGAPVFASALATPSVEISTSMRVSDSLSDGVSFFMAELKRLKAIIDRADPSHRDRTRGHLFLLDEILQGTNSRERQIAVAEVVRSLTDHGSLGAISTHDLELASTSELNGRCDIVHFREHFREVDGRQKMEFDYVMRPGISPTTNALKLLELVGIRRSKGNIQ